MPYRIVGRAEDRIAAVLLESVRRGGVAAAARYRRAIFAGLAALGARPLLPGSSGVAGATGVRVLHLRHVGRLVAREHRVREPRHLIIYRIAPDGVAEILGLVHDRMLLDRAARRAQREADG